MAIEMMENINSHVKAQVIASGAIWSYTFTGQSQRGDARQLGAMSHTPLTALIPPGLDRVAVFHAHEHEEVLLVFFL